jgi:hypothetical protein
MIRIRRWVMGKRRKVVWSEPQLPPYVKINPDSPPGLAEGIQPGDLSMGAVAAEFLEMDEGDQQEGLPGAEDDWGGFPSSGDPGAPPG